MTSGKDIQAILLIMDRRLSQLEQRLADVENILMSNSISVKRSAHRKVEIEDTKPTTAPKSKTDQKRVVVIKREVEVERNHKYSRQTLLKLRRDFYARKGHMTDPFDIKTKIVIIPMSHASSPSSSHSSSPTNAKNGSMTSMSTEQTELSDKSAVSSVETVSKKVAHNLVIEEEEDDEEGESG